MHIFTLRLHRLFQQMCGWGTSASAQPECADLFLNDLILMTSSKGLILHLTGLGSVINWCCFMSPGEKYTVLMQTVRSLWLGAKVTACNVMWVQGLTEQPIHWSHRGNRACNAMQCPSSGMFYQRRWVWCWPRSADLQAFLWEQMQNFSRWILYGWILCGCPLQQCPAEGFTYAFSSWVTVRNLDISLRCWINHNLRRVNIWPTFMKWWETQL